MKRVLMVLLVLLMLISFSVPASAVPGNASDILNEKGLKIHDECSGHPFFQNYIVREDGWYAVFYITSDKSDIHDGIYEVACIDIFNSEGVFLREIQIDSSEGVILNFSDNALEIYLTEWLISVDLETWKATATQTAAYFAQNGDLNSTFRGRKKEAGGWKYSCRGKSLVGYTSLIREKEGNKEVLLSLSGIVPGTDQSIKSVATCGIGAAIVIMLVTWKWKRKRKCNA